MFKKAVLIVFATMLIVFAASISYALQTDGLVSGTDAPTLPGGIQASLNPGGLGDSLLYGYYNVRGALNLFNVVNTNTTDGAKVRIIFRNAKNSKEVLDFNICLSKRDVWTAFVADDGVQGRIFAFDSDTVTGAAVPFPGVGIPFISGTYGDITVTADDTREGYFEIVGMSVIPGYDKNGSITGTCSANTFGGSINCIKTATDCNSWQQIGRTFDVDNVLMGNNTMIDLTSLATYSYNATAVADSSLTAFDVSASKEESIADALSRGPGRGSVNGCHEADYIFTKSEVLTPYDIISGLGGETALILTFPTRFVCHSGLGDTLFECKDQDPSHTQCTAYCTSIGVAIYDDKENLLTGGTISPSPGSCLEHEVNVLNFGTSSPFDSTVAVSVSTGSFNLGWADIDLVAGSSAHSTTTTTVGDPRTAHGIPAVGYTAQSFVGGAATYMVPAAHRTSINP